MKCKEAIEQMIELFDEEGTGSDPVCQHLANCPQCRAHYQEAQQVFVALRPDRRIAASHQFREKTMNAILEEASKQPLTARTTWHWKRWALAVCAVVLLFLIIPILPFGKKPKQAFSLLAQSLQAMTQVQTIHMTGRMRTVPGDNFEYIDSSHEFVPIELWHQYSPDRWRIEKPGRVVVMNGQKSTLFLSQAQQYLNGPAQAAGFVGWLRPLLNPERILQAELQAAQTDSAKTSVTEANGTITLSVTRKAQGSFENSWARNTSIMESDHTCIYNFDASTKRLTGLKVVLHGAKDALVLELNSVQYDEALPASIFALQIPPSAGQIPLPEQMPPADPNVGNAKDAAEYFFKALAKEDWQAVSTVYPTNAVSQLLLKREFGGLTVLLVGEPFKSGMYPGYFVPYKVKLRSGDERSFNLAIRNDNPEKRWVVDGGI